ncbi:hypothetical protein GCM10011344_29930 [Dokdonia pacifica]|uniref:Uncharacterized protein n=1 Tax=Dokdonia pacifica TaxID=1627892 RepID=A0A239C006_9FLAO|nr:hypothetical protein [Dokdonia pacifica]GGG27175.1 hypothetical protein GCM10011344_29930 [Dokdonia pacifica]SNS13486.1 hypothetical protein SAMN06265376_10749 [Dokdonia pacifica]
MKDSKRQSKYWVMLVLVFCVCILNAQQMQQKIEMRIDSIGNARLDITMKMNAQQWQQWIGSLGNNPAALKREIEREMPGYFLDNFKLEKDDMNRSFNLKLDAYGVCKIDKRGNWIIELEEKDTQLTELDSHKYMLVNSPPEYGGQMQQTFMITLPETANNIKTAKDAYGKDIFKFTMEDPSEAGFSGLLPWIGLLLIGGGVSWFFVGKKTQKA